MSKITVSAKESLSGHTFAEDPDNSLLNFQDTDKEPETLLEKIPETPFWLVKQENQYFITFGMRVMTRPAATKEEALLRLKTEQFEITAMYVLAILDEQKAKSIGKH